MDNYGTRDEQEKCFQLQKDPLGQDRTRCWSESSKHGRMFICFIGLILASYVRSVWESDEHLRKKFGSTESVLAEMRTIRCIEHKGRLKFVTPFVGDLIEIFIHRNFHQPFALNTESTNRNRMFAEKLVVSHPLWRGQIQFGEEYTDTRTTNLFTANITEIPDADNRVDESNIAAFVQIAQRFSRFNVGLGLRYEHVKFDYYEMGQLRDAQNKTYDNLFPSLNVAAKIGAVRMGLNYSGKTVRPGYGQLDGAVSYINRLTVETGNPWLKPTKMQTVEYKAQWRQFFAQVSYTHFKDGVYHITEPYGADGEATIIRTANLDHRHYFQAFAGGHFKLGVWQPRVNVGVMKQWLTLPVDGKPLNMNTPGFMFQWQNAVRLPFDIWLNVDAQLTTPSWDNNMKLTSTPWHINAKIYKGFFNNAFSVTLEAKDLFDSARHDATMYNDAVRIVLKNFSTGRSVMLMLQYRFNTTRNRYCGTGAGNSEESRF